MPCIAFITFIAGAGAAAFLAFFAFIAFIAFIAGAGSAAFTDFMAFMAFIAFAGAAGPLVAASISWTTTWRSFGMVMIGKGSDLRNA